MIVRSATAADAEAFVRVLLVAAEEGLVATEPPIDFGARVARLQEEVDGDNVAGHWVLVDDEGRVAGIAGAHETTACGVVSLGVALLPEARGRGFGRALVEAVLTHAGAVGAHKVELDVWPDNERAIRLYESLGFTIEGLRRDHYRRRDGTLRSAVLMVRLLHGACESDAEASGARHSASPDRLVPWKTPVTGTAGSLEPSAPRDFRTALGAVPRAATSSRRRWHG